MNKIVEPVKEKEESSTLPLEFIVGELKRVEGEEFAYLSDLLVKQTAGLAYKLAYGKLGKRELAEDAVQDAYELVFLKMHQLRDPSAFKSWFCRIVVHCCHKHFCTKPDFEEPAVKIRAQTRAASAVIKTDSGLEISRERRSPPKAPRARPNSPNHIRSSRAFSNLCLPAGFAREVGRLIRSTKSARTSLSGRGCNLSTTVGSVFISMLLQ